ncbi:VTT domain-containing protein [Patescibacteria group bacterium]|nr:VTT domain-containing protein [Patescibacteria group bacterium]
MGRFFSGAYRRIGSYIGFAALFILVSYVMRGHEDNIRLLLAGGGAGGAILFVLLTATFVIFIIPLDIVFLIPLGVNVWGPLPTALLSIAGWTIGASVAFSLARRYGLSLVARIIGARNAAKLHDRVPLGDPFWSVVLLRVLVPVDLLSYALGLFTDMPWRRYVLATLIGVAPFGFVFAYVGALPSWYQFLSFASILVLVSFMLLQYQRKLRLAEDDDPSRGGQG